jgi:hypothetical protein
MFAAAIRKLEAEAPSSAQIVERWLDFPYPPAERANFLRFARKLRAAPGAREDFLADFQQVLIRSTCTYLLVGRDEIALIREYLKQVSLFPGRPPGIGKTRLSIGQHSLPDLDKFSSSCWLRWRRPLAQPAQGLVETKRQTAIQRL